MRLFTRFAAVLVALTLSLHYYCRVSECSVELQNACRYTSPAGINQLLLEKNGFYRDQVHPVVVLVQDEYTKRLEPRVLKLGSDLYRNVYLPVAVSAREHCGSVNLSDYTGWFVKQFARFRRRVAFYYNVTLKPSVQRVVYYCKLDEVCKGIHAKLGPFLEKVRLLLHYVRPWTERAKSSVAQGYSELKGKFYRSSHWMSGGSFYEKTGSSDEATYSSDSETEVESDEEDDEDDFETSTMTSTVLVTVTLDEQAVASSTDADVAELSELETLQDEFDAWSRLIDQKSSSIIGLFDRDTEEASQQEIERVSSDIQHKTQQLSDLAQSYFQRLTKSIQDINCTAEVDPNTGELLYFDRTGTTQLAAYITRPLVRAIFNETHVELEKKTHEIEQDLRELTARIETCVSTVREEILELYEEWGDVMITEWSKRLAYVDVVSAHFGADAQDGAADAQDVSADNWKKFLRLKRQVIRARNELAESPAPLAAFKTFIHKAQFVVETITKESGEYLYILRARANLAFQERERQERERSLASMARMAPTNRTVCEETPDHVEDRAHRPVQESMPVQEQQE